MEPLIQWTPNNNFELILDSQDSGMSIENSVSADQWYFDIDDNRPIKGLENDTALISI